MLVVLAKATQRHPDNEDVCLEAFAHYLRVGEIKSAQQVRSFSSLRPHLFPLICHKRGRRVDSLRLVPERTGWLEATADRARGDKVRMVVDHDYSAASEKSGRSVDASSPRPRRTTN